MTISMSKNQIEKEALQVLTCWVHAFTKADVEAIVELYAYDASFIGTGSKSIVTKPAGIRTYFEMALLGDRKFVASFTDVCATVLSESVVVVAALDKLVMTTKGETKTHFGRVSFVITQHESNWKISHFHRSEMPA